MAEPATLRHSASVDDDKVMQDEQQHVHPATLAKDSEKDAVPTQGGLKLDRHGLPMNPQPTDHPEDPLNWPLMYRWYLALLISTLAFFAQLGSSLINPSFVPMAKELGVSDQRASYATTIYILSSGLMPLTYVPFSNVYGRRPFYLGFLIIAIAATVGSGAAKTYGGMMTGRFFYGIGGSAPIALGAASICDMFPVSERGLPMGMYALFISNGPHIAPIIGGYIALDINWRWCFYIPGMIIAFMWFVVLFTFPETLFARSPSALAKLPAAQGLSTSKAIRGRLFRTGKILTDRTVKPKDFIISFRMAKYVAVMVPCMFMATTNTFGSAMYAVTGGHLFKQLFKFNTAQTGLLMGLPLTIGCTIGELCTGYFSDVLIRANARRNGGKYKPEARLYLLPLTLLCNAGSIGYGFAVAQHRHWSVLAVCMGIAGVGLQTTTTLVYAYTTDSYKPQAAEVGTVINVTRQIVAFTIGFYALPFGESHGFDYSFGILDGLLNGLMLIPFIALIFVGERVRNAQGKVGAHEDL